MRIAIILCCIVLGQSCLSQEILSPDGNISVKIDFRDGLRYSVSYMNKLVIEPSAIDMKIGTQSLLGQATTSRKAVARSVRQTINATIPEKRKVISDHYNELVLPFPKSFSVIFRVYNDGVAYRFETKMKDSIIVTDELSTMKFADNYPVYFSAVVKRDGADSFHTSFEEPYQYKTVDSITASHLIFTPTLVAPARGAKFLLTESDLEDYPGMFLTGTGTNELRGKFAPYPLEEKMTEGEFPQYVVTQRAPYIAKTKGTRLFPWRIIAISKEDKELPSTDIVYRLASPSRIADASWVKPGKATDEWIIGINLFNVPFKTGINTATYKYYIDFAKRFGFDRIMMDAGWSDYKDLFKINPALNMDEIAAYAAQQGIKLSMWTLALTLEKQLEPALQQFKKWGVDFIMTDFMDRDDQPMVNFYYRIAEACARQKIMIMYHGAFKPAGFQRTYPNSVTREGVLGSEYNIWSDKATPAHNVLLPYIRMVSGPMDYEPGILDNATQKTFRPIGEKVMAPGTRCHQLAMFVVYESPIQIFAGNPSTGYQEPRFMELLGSIPTTWDETIVMDGKVGEYIITARKKGNDWYIGGMTNWTARNLNISLSFLDDGNYKTLSCEDGINADRYPSDYILTDSSYQKSNMLPVNMAPGGGFMMRLIKN